MTLNDFMAIDYPDGRNEVVYVIGQTRISIETARGQSGRSLAQALRKAAKEIESLNDSVH